MSQNLPYQIIQHNIHHIHDYSNIHYQVLNSAGLTCHDTLVISQEELNMKWQHVFDAHFNRKKLITKNSTNLKSKC